MIGNDIVDLVLARKESRWERRGFLDKIFSDQEQILIKSNVNPELMVWNLWTRKEAAYKIYNRFTAIKGYFPKMLECYYENEHSGVVRIDDFVFHTKTQITKGYVYTIAVSETIYFDKIKMLETAENVIKTDGIPNSIDTETNATYPVSITHHGRFQRIIILDVV